MQEKGERYYEAYLSHNTISRRGLLRGILGGSEHSTVHEVNVLNRPPFSSPEHLFRHFCNGCSHCVSACPYGLIQIQDGLAHLVFDFSACDFCGKCAEICSTNALNSVFQADTLLRPKFQSHCLQKNSQSCHTCQQTCPQQAISPQLEIDNEKCNGCGQCKIACFVSAISF
ncbi:ferredoxin-type protein NapF [Pasteurellaceae bacterium 15-036681]|nr:ferredoxin-type protein NapF [Pasteurellaceae bacterium 15-036681]